MIVYRLSRARWKNKLSGKGASMNGGRWNSEGIEMIYTASSRALAMAEVLVHLEPSQIPSDYVMLTINIPDDVKTYKPRLEVLPLNWNVPINYQSLTQRVGDEFIRKGAACVLIVPSAVVKGDFNYLINPHHPSFEKITITQSESFPFDQRLFK